VKERSVPWHTFPFIYLCFLPYDCCMERPKRAGKSINERVFTCLCGFESRLID
jgi:hypothetical protein